MEKPAKLVTPEGQQPNLRAVQQHLAAKDLGNVLVQEVHFHSYRDDYFNIPVLECGIIKDISPKQEGIYVPIGESFVFFPKSDDLLTFGIARVTNSKGIVYEDPRLVQNWDALLTEYENKLDQFKRGLKGEAKKLVSASAACRGSPESKQALSGLLDVEHELKILADAAPGDPFVQFMNLCHDRLYLLDDYGFSKNKHGVYVRKEIDNF